MQQLLHQRLNIVERTESDLHRSPPLPSNSPKISPQLDIASLNSNTGKMVSDFMMTVDNSSGYHSEAV